MNRWFKIALVAGVVLSLVAAYRMAHLTLTLGSREGRWVYEYLYAFNARSLTFCGVAVLVCAGLLLAPAAVVRRREWWFVVFWVLAGTTVHLRLRTLAPYSMARMFESDGSDGYYGATRQYPALVLLRDFDRLRPGLTIHPRSNMPGKLALVYALERISFDPETLADMIVVLSNMGGIVLYLFVRDLTGDPSTAVASLALYLFVPAKMFFFPILNTVTPVVLLMSLYLWLRVLKTGSWTSAIALGPALLALTVFEPLPLVTGLVFVGLGISAVARRDILGRALTTRTAAAAASFVLSAILVRVWLQFDLLAVFRHLMNDAVEFNAVANRPYRIWIWRNLIDFSVGTGLCQVLLFLALLAGGIWQAGRRHIDWREPVTAFAFSLGIAIVATDLLGVNRGEVIRLWIFFACLVQVPAAYACVRLNNRAALLTTLAASLVIGTLGTSMIAFGQP